MIEIGKSAADTVVSQRFEAKYVISELQAREVREYIRPFMGTDPNAKYGHRYMLSSLYLDSPEMSLFWSSRLGEKNRFKLRVRTYTEDPREPVFFEIKRRVDGIVRKQRAIVRKEYVADILDGNGFPQEALVKPTPDETYNLFDFCNLMEIIRAEPRCHVRYEREAHMSLTGEPLRITFDRHLACLPGLGDKKVSMEGPGWTTLDHIPVILEIKFTDTFPFWIHHMVQHFNLMRGSFAKYVHCVEEFWGEGTRLAGFGGEVHAV